MPVLIERGVRRQNIVFMHDRNQFCPEYFKFIRKLLHCNKPINDKTVSISLPSSTGLDIAETWHRVVKTVDGSLALDLNKRSTG